MPTYKLKYFNSRGFGEVPRYLFALAGQEYEDIRFTQDTWKAEKDNTPFGQMPVLIIDGKHYGQSGAISRYLARIFGFYGKDDTEGLQVEQVLGIVQDVITFMIKAFYEKDAEQKEALIKEGKEEKTPMYMKMLVKILTANGNTGYCVGEKISLADVAVFDLSDKLQILFKASVDDYPEVKKCVEMVGGNEKIEAWIKKRPVTDN